MRGPSARREFGFVLALAVTGLALVLVVAFAPWYQPAAGYPGVDPTFWQHVTALFGATEGNTTP
ncbi:hypothetical protein Aab01nite_22290 [Paractinoplanes abujensis]|uniref:Uncharacterized protein n=1 Tax=Paractinoplanes abujensis TaxID=882441 RepID=A0A7W7G5F1_9ACTN|nr:hypothetical protein [Actinoplanes abujensis]MBB4696892.1 hypothetical protein [Actinoplanes abujensis]GID18639.1 hypothetical protein Aab01nite_22290 [Actinoplanes abujensis]